MRSRWMAYAGVSVSLAAGVILKAMHQRPNFYSAAVYLAQSSANLMILTNLIFLIACTILLGLQKLLFGPLRPVEVETLYEKAWFAVTETCLAMTIFRGEIGGWFLVMFFSLLAAKVWGWIGEGRVEVLEQQPPQNPRLFHTRLAISLSMSVLFDTFMLEYLIKQVLNQARPDMMVMFGFEFAVLTITSTSTMARYAISLVEIYIVRKQKEKRVEEMRRERREAALQATTSEAASTSVNTDGAPQTASADTSALAASAVIPPPVEAPIDDAEVEVEGWEEKGRWVFYLDLTTDFLKLVVYLSFFFILLVFYGLPIHIMRDVFLTCRSFFKRIADFMKYRTATKDMNERYPDATAEEIAREDTCIICREEMVPLPPVNQVEGAPAPPPNPVAERMRPKKLPCGHILHFACLRSWLERQQICPTCRRPVVPTQRGPVGGVGQLAANAGQPNVQVPRQPVPNQVHQADGQAAEGQNRLRMLNFGPLRIGFGAGRGDLVNDLAQQIHNEQARPPQAANEDRAQQYGFGFGFGRPRAAHGSRTNASVHSQLTAIEQRLQHDISELRLAANELHIVRMLEAELNRLRGLRQASGGQAGGASPNITQANPPPGQPAPVTIRPAQALVASTQQPVLTAGSDGLPEGLTLPPGWTMMPLHRLDAMGQLAAPAMSSSASAPVNPTPIQNPATQHRSSSDDGPANSLSATASNAAQSALGNGIANAHDQAADPVSTLFGGDVFNRPSAPSPPTEGNASNGAELTVPAATTSQPETSITLPSLPTWGANAPSASPIPSDPSSLPNGEATTNGDSASAPTQDVTARLENGVEQEASASAAPSQPKGKHKAASVEDAIEGPD